MWDRLSTERVADSAKKAKDVDGTLHFTRAFSDRLALLAREQFGKLIFARLETLGCFAENPTSGCSRHSAPLSKRCSGRLNGACCVFAATEGVLRDDLSRIRRVLVLMSASGLGRQPFPPNKILIGAHALFLQVLYE